MSFSSKYFSRKEFQCRGTNCGSNGGNCGYNTVDYQLVRVLEDVREHFAKPVSINSGCRCEKHNASVGGSPKSQHLIGRAADIVVKNVDSSKVFDYLKIAYPNSLGLGLYDTFVHVDTRDGMARW